MHFAYLGLGSNLGERMAYLEGAVERLAQDERITVGEISPVYESEAHIRQDQSPAPDFLNAVVRIETDYTPHELLERCLEIERNLGRERETPRHPKEWLPRTIDIDILLIDELIVADDHLTVPHPRLHQRRFVLQPLADIAPDAFVPAPHDTTVKQLLAACPDKSDLTKVSETSNLQPSTSNLQVPTFNPSPRDKE